MTVPRTIADITDQQLDRVEHERSVAHVQAGATVSFCGVVREHDHGRDVVSLEYQAHPSAQAVLSEIAAGIAALPEVLAVAVSHRVGELEVGDIALVAAVSTPHRKEAFELCAQLVEEVKQRLPIWKRQVFEDGSDEWVNCP